MHSVDYAAASRLSVRLSLCLSVRYMHAGILSKQLKNTLKLFYCPVATSF